MTSTESIVEQKKGAGPKSVDHSCTYTSSVQVCTPEQAELQVQVPDMLYRDKSWSILTYTFNTCMHDKIHVPNLKDAL